MRVTTQGAKKRRASEGPSNGKRMTSEDGNKSLKHSMTLLAHGRKVGANATEAGSPILSSEGARNLLLDFCHPKISFSLIVRKWEREVVQKSQHLVGSIQEGIEQILGGSLFGRTLAFGNVVFRDGRWRLSSITSSENIEVLSDPVISERFGDSPGSSASPIMSHVVHGLKRFLHSYSPLLSGILCNASSIA